ncbi:MAG: two-component regulator propeller domain-containing protein [Melioribacteraceae bacterium]
MKSLVLFYILTLSYPIFSQNNEWINYFYGKEVISFTGDGNNMWVGTRQGGMVKLNSQTGEKTYFNKANSSLPENEVRALEFDSNGNLWIGTIRGLAKFNGTDWIIFNPSNSGLPYNNISSITFDNEKNVWIGTDGGGLAKYNGNDWLVMNMENTQNAITSNYIHNVVIDSNGNKWIGTYAGLAKYNETSWFTVYKEEYTDLPKNNIQAIVIDNDGNKWIGTSNGLAKFDDQNWTIYNTSNSGLPDNWIKSLLIDNDLNLWIGTNNGLAKFDGTDWTVYNTSNSGLPNNSINTLFIDNNSDFWIGTDYNLAKFNGTNWNVINVDQCGLLSPFTYIETISFDHENNAWFSAYDANSYESWKLSGIIKFDGKNWIVRTYPDSKYSWATSSIADNFGNIWVGTENGLLKYDGSDWDSFDSTYSMFTDQQITSLSLDLFGKLWVGTNSGLIKIEGSNITKYNSQNSGMVNDWVDGLNNDQNGNLWICSSIGGVTILEKFDGFVWTHYSTPFADYEGTTSIVTDKIGNVWLSSYSGGLAKFDGSQWVVYNTSNSELPNNYLSCLAVDSIGNIWIGTQFDGLTKFDGTNWTNFSYWNSGLSSDDIMSLAFDKFNNLWIGTNNSISVFKEGGIVLSTQEKDVMKMPTNFILKQNYPNPFNPSTTIEYSIPQKSQVTIKIYDLLGREITTLINEEKPVGNYFVKFDGGSLTSGVYFYRLQSNTFSQTRKLILLK